MGLISKRRFSIIFGLLIIVLYFVLRLPNLTLQPIFADEAIYIRWAQVMRAEPTLRFLPLSDGKTPLFMWTLMPFLKIFEDPLFAGRFLSVITGFFTLLGVFALAWRVFNIRVALWSALLYAVVPYTVFFDRMALVDSMLASFTIWSIFLSVMLLISQRLDLSMVLGFLLGGALLTKTPAMVNLLVLPITLLGFDFKKRSKYGLIKLAGCWIVALVIGFGIYNLLRLGPGFDQLSSRNGDYVFSLTELSGRPLDPFLPHFGDIKDWFPKLLTWPVVLLIAVGVVWVVMEKNRKGLIILIWALIPLLLFMAFLKTFTARYLLLSIPPLLVIAGYGVEGLRSRSIRISQPLLVILLLFLILSQALLFDYQLLTNPQKAPLPRAERKGYFEDWTAGYNFKEIANFLKEKSKDGPVVVETEGYFGTLPDGLLIYLNKTNVTVIGGPATASAKIKDAALNNQAFYVANKNRIRKNPPEEKLIMEFPKFAPLDGSLQDAIVVYQIK